MYHMSQFIWYMHLMDSKQPEHEHQVLSACHVFVSFGFFSFFGFSFFFPFNIFGLCIGANVQNDLVWITRCSRSVYYYQFGVYFSFDNSNEIYFQHKMDLNSFFSFSITKFHFSFKFASC